LPELLERLRRLASVAMGLAHTPEAAALVGSVPKVGVVSASRCFTSLDGRAFAEADVDVTARMLSMGLPHKAVPVTCGIALAVAARLPGTVVAPLLAAGCGSAIRVGHPSGVLVVDAAVDHAAPQPVVRSATVFRTTRRLFEGRVVLGSRGSLTSGNAV
jgi:2-methylaconitate cis-trans-isomerase PrpF